MNFQILPVIYFFALSVEIFAAATQNLPLQYFSKPSLMLILILYYAINTKKSGSEKYLIISALTFSWLGDVLLLLDKQFQTLFIYGLIAFLLAHIFYIFYFWQIRKANNPEKLPNPLIFVFVAAYSLTLFAIVAPNVKNLVIPVSIYALIISTMLAASLAAFDFGRQSFGKICVAGTLLFLLSDSILAINRFVAPFEYAPVLIMLTYAFAQLLITEGSLRNLGKISATNNTNNTNY
ncbi:MAG TPA: lysoplasmalogenase [Pyrinomonadaceae bacterium]|nr:lysoplasmalogenase [Pyrinomonadaceae bacterium]